MAKPDRHALAARDVGVRKPLSPGWHAELPAPFYQHDVYREFSDGTRMHMGTLTVEAVEAWQRVGKKRARSGRSAIGSTPAPPERPDTETRG